MSVHLSADIAAGLEERALTAAGGAYVLDLRLARSCSFGTRLLGAVHLGKGRYLYAGSAYGPGGLRARIGRHLRTGKTPRWHIDHLTDVAGPIGVIAVLGGNECVLVAGLRSIAGTAVPVAGFGSSDCRRCPAHLYSWSRDDPLQTLADRLFEVNR